jgi:hypothetical protein
MADTKIGFSPAYALFSIDDPDGDAKGFNGFQAVGLTTIHDMNNKYRLMSVFNYYKFSVDPSGEKIGQNVKGYQIGALVQHIIRVARGLNFYAGGGVAYTNADFTSRHNVDEDGYLLNRYHDRTESFCYLLANVSKEWEVTKSFEIGADVTYQYAIGDGFSGFKGALSLFYSF